MNIFDKMMKHALNYSRIATLKQDITFNVSCFSDEEFTFEKGTVADMFCQVSENEFHFENGNYAIIVTRDEVEIA